MYQGGHGRAARTAAGRTVALAALALQAACGGDLPVPTPFMQDGPGFYQELSWSPDGTSLLVSVLEITEGDPGFAYRVWSLDPDRATAVPITDGPGDYWTSWSPDGERVALASRGNDGGLDIVTMRPDGSDLRRLTSSGASETQPAWSPDGARIAFVSDASGRGQIQVASADGSGATPLLESAGEAQNPEWSPDGTRIAFYETDASGTNRVVVVGADGRDPVTLVEGLWPSWTPDGGALLYGGDGGLFRIALPDGSPELLVPGNVLAGELTRDGTRLAWIVSDETNVSVVVGGPEGGGARTAMSRPRPRW